MSLARSSTTAASSLSRFRTTITQAASAVRQLQTSAGGAGPTLDRIRGGSDRLNTSLGRLRTAATTGGSGLDRIKSTAVSADGGMGKARAGADKFKTSLDRLKSSADKAKNALQDVKRQADGVEKSVGKAGKNADKGGKSMDGLGKGLKGASLAQRGLNLAMAASPFGLIMTLLAPLIARFVNMDKVMAVAKRGMTAAWNAMRSASSSAARFLGPLFKGVVNAFLLPTRMLVRGLNSLIGGLNQVKFSVPDWVPVIGGKGFAFNLPRIPVPQLAQGGIVEARAGGRLALIGEGGEAEAVIPLSRLERMLGGHPGGAAGMTRLAQAVERLAERPVHIEVDSQTIARAVLVGQRKLARR
ncbi:hypothetical protein [Streptomyces liangshanensis]|uniref:Uncharacterized protein n=1 Tax=Streptomyces liangshanensis TaxID=2717324 RepID=A0A6G9H2D2_9ACTN|nr:hypothetical protein [Streptomyces liangshanensis]QIQ04692.1 hypothetical protein HA039_22535 [Streptomyces liangshanensis]